MLGLKHLHNCETWGSGLFNDADTNDPWLLVFEPNHEDFAGDEPKVRINEPTLIQVPAVAQAGGPADRAKARVQQQGIPYNNLQWSSCLAQLNNVYLGGDQPPISSLQQNTADILDFDLEHFAIPDTPWQDTPIVDPTRLWWKTHLDQQANFGTRSAPTVTSLYQPFSLALTAKLPLRKETDPRTRKRKPKHVEPEKRSKVKTIRHMGACLRC